jgi:hypothetical protein
VDFSKAIRELYAEKEKIEQTILLLEELQRGTTGNSSAPAVAPKRRGRKLMGLEERKLVSERMRKYWAARRKQQGTPAADNKRAK